MSSDLFSAAPNLGVVQVTLVVPFASGANIKHVSAVGPVAAGALLAGLMAPTRGAGVLNGPSSSRRSAEKVLGDISIASRTKPSPWGSGK